MTETVSNAVDGRLACTTFITINTATATANRAFPPPAGESALLREAWARKRYVKTHIGQLLRLLSDVECRPLAHYCTRTCLEPNYTTAFSTQRIAKCSVPGFIFPERKTGDYCNYCTHNTSLHMYIANDFKDFNDPRNTFHRIIKS